LVVGRGGRQGGREIEEREKEQRTDEDGLLWKESYRNRKCPYGNRKGVKEDRFFSCRRKWWRKLKGIRRGT